MADSFSGKSFTLLAMLVLCICLLVFYPLRKAHGKITVEYYPVEAMKKNHEKESLILTRVMDPEVKSNWVEDTPEENSVSWDKKLIFAPSISDETSNAFKSSYESQEKREYQYGLGKAEQEKSIRERKSLMDDHMKSMAKWHIENFNDSMKTASKDSTLGRVYSAQKDIENASKVKVNVDDNFKISSKFQARELTNRVTLDSTLVKSEFRWRLAPGLFGDSFERDNPMSFRMEKELAELGMTGTLRYGFQKKSMEFEWKAKFVNNFYGVAEAKTGDLSREPLERSIKLNYQFLF